MGRPRSPSTNITPPRKARPAEPRSPVAFDLTAKELADLDAIARDLARRDRSVPSRPRALRWAIRELSLRIYLGRGARAAKDTAFVGTVGPASAPPDP